MLKRKTNKSARKSKDDFCVKITPSISKAFKLSGLKKSVSKNRTLCLYVEIYDELGKLVSKGCMDNGCGKVGWCEYKGGKKCRCVAIV